MNKFTAEQNLSLWEDRAANPDWQAGSNDPLMTQLEVAALSRNLDGGGESVLDVGCGNGSTIKELRQLGHTCRFTGVDISPKMIQAAENVGIDATFHVGDVTNFNLNEKFDTAFSIRCLINLETPDRQQEAFANIAKHLKSGGLYFCVEAFASGLLAINALREKTGLVPIEMPWHNLYLTDDSYRRSFNKVWIEHFASTYYLTSRIFSALLAVKEKRGPEYTDFLNLHAMQLPAFGEFAPHRLVVLRKKSI